MTLFTKVTDLLKERGADDVVVFRRRHQSRKPTSPSCSGWGVAKIFTPGAATMIEIVDCGTRQRRFPSHRLTSPRRVIAGQPVGSRTAVVRSVTCPQSAFERADPWRICQPSFPLAVRT